jgi:toxin ParE1/3/4
VKRRVRYKDAAKADLIDIYRYIARFNLDAAERYVRGLRARCESLGQTPLLGRLRSDLRAGWRSVPHRSHVIFYELVDGRPVILRILHGARDIPAALSGDG